MIDIINNWQILMTFVTLFTSIGGFIYMIKDHGKRLAKLEEWKDKVVDGRLQTIENKLDTFMAGHDGKDKLIDEKFSNILDKIDQICLWKK